MATSTKDPTMGLNRSSTTSLFTSNLDVEYVISFRYDSTASGASDPPEKQLEKLIRALDNVGMRVEVRDGGNGNLLVFVRVRSEQKILGEIYRSRVRDWLHGIRPSAPEKETQASLEKEPLTCAERLRLVHSIITLPEAEGGAGITPKQGDWEFVESIFPLHDHDFNKKWLKDWSTKWAIGPEDITLIKEQFGEKIAFYFAFLQSYFLFLGFPAIVGLFSHLILPAYSSFFATMNCLWSVVFVEWWKRQEVDLAVRWGVRGCSSMQRKRAEFVPEAEVEDPVTGELVQTFPAWKRLTRQAIQIPFALFAGTCLTAIIACVFSIEIFITEVYNGPLKNILKFLPTALLSICVPTVSTLLTQVATWLNKFENYENQDSHEAAMTQKIFVLNFITGYIPLFLTAFVYVPFGETIVPYLDVLNVTVEHFGHDEKYTTSDTGFTINPDRLKSQMIYFVVTAQVVNFALEIIVPYVKRVAFKKAKEIQRKGSLRIVDDSPEEKKFMNRVRSESELDIYDVTVDLREMCMQFGYLTLFSPIWPVTAISFVINNLVELRSDAAKICLEMQRPIPTRGDSIGPWLDNLGFLTWLGSLSSAALVYLFSGEGEKSNRSTDGLLLAVLFSEHIYFGARILVKGILSKMPSAGREQEGRERFLVRKRFLEESLGQDNEIVRREDEATGGEYSKVGVTPSGEKELPLTEGLPAERFWNKQKGWQQAYQAGIGIIAYVQGEEKKKQ